MNNPSNNQEQVTQETSQTSELVTTLESKNVISLSNKSSAQQQVTTDEVYECQFPECDRRFTTKFSLKRHYYIHSRQKTFTCEYCSKSFALPQYLKEHQYTHTNQEPFVCGVDGCTEAFRQRGKLSLHRRTHNNFKKKDYRLLNTMSESEHFNTLLGIVEKLKRPYSQSESALQVEAINDQQENLSIQPESENQNQTTTLKHVEESDHQQCKSTQSTNVTLSNSLSFSLSNCDQSRLQDISLSKKSLLLQTSQHVIDFVNQNETECAKLLSNNWAPMKRRRITHAQKMEMLNNQQASTQQQNSNMVSQEDFSFSCDNQQKSKHEKTIHQNQDLQYRLNDNFFKNLENQQISTDSYPNAQSNLQDYFQGPQNIQYQQEKLNLPEDRYTNLNYNNVVIKSQNQINNIDESQNNQRVQGNNKNESNIVKPIFNKPLISLQQQQGSQVFPMTSGLPYMNQSLVTNINNHNQYQQQQIFANNLIFQRQQQQAIIASSIASEKQHLFYGVPNMNNVAGLRAQQQVILVQNPNQSYFYNPNLIPQYGMGMYYQNKQISNTQSNQ